MPALPRQLETWLLWASGLSLGLLVVSAALGPLIIGQLPEDYFVSRRPRPRRSGAPRALQLLVLGLRNLIGGLLVLLGALMLVLPGQGILTILAGLLVMSFPRKRSLLARALAGERVQQSLNYLRKRMGKVPLKFPH